MRRFYAPNEQFQTTGIRLDPDETRHLRDVLRLKETDRIQIFDGAGREFLCEIVTIEKKQTALKIIEEIAPTAPESSLHLTLAVGLLKGEKFDWVVQKAVELGVTKLVPLNTKRADVKLKETAKRSERWRKIALEACKQTGRAKLMLIAEPLDYDKFIETADGTRILFAERGGESFSAIEPTEKINAVIGAEGGWDDSEIEAAHQNNFQVVTLKNRILRAETAAITVAAILQNQFGDLN